MITSNDEPSLRRALRLAMNGRGHVEPNPMVGCVLVKKGVTIGEGWHGKFGGPHAEPIALADCQARGNDPAGATAYVTLEPCCHQNKKTPPCAPRLIEAKIARVVIGCLDPNPAVNGNGVAMLRAAGIDVDVLPQRGLGFQPVISSMQQLRVENPCHELDGSHFQQLIAPFIKQTSLFLPYVTAKWAETIDGSVGGAGGTRLTISGKAANRLVHTLRTRVDGIVVGLRTVLADDPMLTPREVPLIRIPRRWVIDTQLRIPLTSKLVRTAREYPTAVLGWWSGSDHAARERLAALGAAGIIVMDSPALDGRLNLAEAMYRLRWNVSQSAVIAHLLIEPGRALAAAVLSLVDRLWVIRSHSARSPDGLRAAEVPGPFIPTGTLDLAGDTLTEYLNTASPVFFAAVPSADFVVAQEHVARATSP